MSKYAPLETHLQRSSASMIPMTFDEIEKILGFALPPSKEHRAWWSNNPNNNVMTKAWLSAGYETEQVDIAGRKLVFRRVARTDQTAANGDGQSHRTVKTPRRHPLFGWMSGMLTIAPEADLTAPADPDWADMAWGEQTKDDNKNAA